MAEEVIEQLRSSLLDLEKEAAVEKARLILQQAEQVPVKDAVDAVSGALQIVGERFQSGEWYLSELIYAGEIAKEVLNLLGPLMEAGASEKLGTIVVGTVSRDLHDLGKNIVASMLEVHGFEVFDLGVNVEAQAFVRRARDVDADIVGVSCLLTTSIPYVRDTVQLIKGNEDDSRHFKVLVGGGPIDIETARRIGADAYGEDAADAVIQAERLLGQN